MGSEMCIRDRKSPLPEGDEPGLKETSFYDPSNFSFPAGTHIAEVEIDPETGHVKLEKYTACDDFGRIINPMVGRRTSSWRSCSRYRSSIV